MATHLSRAARRDQRPRRRPAGLALALTALALPLPALADWPVQHTAALEQQEAQGLTRLSTPERCRYFEARRQLERRGADQRLAELRQLEDCLERTRQRAGAQSCLEQAQRQRYQERQQWAAQLSALRQRYRLPVMPASSAQPQSWQPGWRPQPQPAAMAPYGWY